MRGKEGGEEDELRRSNQYLCDQMDQFFHHGNSLPFFGYFFIALSLSPLSIAIPLKSLQACACVSFCVRLVSLFRYENVIVLRHIAQLIAIGVMGFGIWLSSHDDGCRKSLTLPVLGLGGIILLISLIGFLGALKNNSILLWIYLIMLCFILVAILVFTVLAFIVTNNGSGHKVDGLRYKEYQLQDYSTWFLKQLNDSHNWRLLKACLVKADDCNNLSKKYKTLMQYKAAKLTPIEAGCCRPPSDCGYPAVNASYHDLSYHPASSNGDCKLYKNARDVKCYNCDSCKAGVAQYMKTEWRVVAIFSVALFVVLSMVYFVGCCARRNAASSDSKD